MLVCSPGGHLFQMLALAPACRDRERVWATCPATDVERLLAEEDVVYAHGPTHRSLKMAVKNLPVAWRAVRAHEPDAIVSTGAALAVPFFLVGRLLGKRLIYVESVTRVNGLSLSGKLVLPLSNIVFVQWPSARLRVLLRSLKRVRHAGSVL